MQKRGQVAVFVVIGIVIVILAVLIFVGRKEYGILIPTATFLGDKLDPIKEDLKSCVDLNLEKNFRIFAKQGGDFEPSRYVYYQNSKVKYLCYNIENSNKCINMLPPLNSVIENLNNNLNNDIKNCVSKDLVESGLGYEVNSKAPETKLEVFNDEIKVVVDYDVQVTKGGSTQSLSKIDRRVDLPIVDLYNVAYDIVNAHASEGFFEQLFYMLDKKGKYIINVDKSPSTGNVGDIIYKINKKDSDFEFWFAVEGE